MAGSVNIAAEDALSEAVLRRLLAQAQSRPKVAASFPVRKGYQTEIRQNGYGQIKNVLPAFNAAAKITPFVVLMDADDRACPGATIVEWLSNQPRHPCLIIRIAVREVEAWLLADSRGLAEFLSVREDQVPADPESLADPKQTIVDLASGSRSSSIRGEIGAPINSVGKTGPYYNQALSTFVRDFWDHKEAAKASPSLARAKIALDTL